MTMAVDMAVDPKTATLKSTTSSSTSPMDTTALSTSITSETTTDQENSLITICSSGLLINKVDSYTELRLKRISMSECFDNVSHKIRIVDQDEDDLDPFGAIKEHQFKDETIENHVRYKKPIYKKNQSNVPRKVRANGKENAPNTPNNPKLTNVGVVSNFFRNSASSRSVSKSRSQSKQALPHTFPAYVDVKDTQPSIRNSSTSSITNSSDSDSISGVGLKSPRLAPVSKPSKSSTCRLLTKKLSLVKKSPQSRITKPTKPHTKKAARFRKLKDADRSTVDYGWEQASCMRNGRAISLSSVSQFSMTSACNQHVTARGAQQRKQRNIKCMLVGEALCGKSALLSSFLRNSFQMEYKPTIVEDYEAKVTRNDATYSLCLFDTAGQEDWETLRIMAYPDTDVIILCFSVVRADSMDNIKTKWMPELNKYLPNALVILVGTQVDLRVDAPIISTLTSKSSTSTSNPLNDLDVQPSTRHITHKEGEELRAQIKAYKYIECSALTQLNIKDVFEASIDAVAGAQKKSSSSCFHNLMRRLIQTLRNRFRRNPTTAADQTNMNKTNNKKSYNYIQASN